MICPRYNEKGNLNAGERRSRQLGGLKVLVVQRSSRRDMVSSGKYAVGEKPCVHYLRSFQFRDFRFLSQNRLPLPSFSLAGTLKKRPVFSSIKSIRDMKDQNWKRFSVVWGTRKPTARGLLPPVPGR